MPTRSQDRQKYNQGYDSGGEPAEWVEGEDGGIEPPVVDITPPLLNGASATVTGQSSAILSVNTTEDNGDVNVVATLTATPPTGDQVEDGQTNTGAAAPYSSHLFDIVTAGVKQFFPVTLAAATQYYAHFFHRDAAGNPSNVVSVGFITQAAVDVTAPLLTNANALPTGPTTATLSVDTNEGNGKVSCTVQLSATVPTGTQVENGQTNTGAAALFAGNIPGLTTAGTKTFLGTGFSAVLHWAYFVHRDAAGNLSSVVAKSFTPSSVMATTMQTSIAWGNVTYFFNKPVRVGRYADNQPFAVSDQVFTITSITPAGIQIASGAFTSGGTPYPAGTLLWANGAMINPVLQSDGGIPQGFDQILSVVQDTGGPNTGNATSYLHTTNVDPATNGAISIAIGDAKSIVKSIRKSGITTPGGWLLIGEWRVLHVVPSVPIVNAFAPSATKLDKTSYFTTDMRNKAALGSGFATSAGMPSFATVTDPTLTYMCDLQPFFGQQGEKLRLFIADKTGQVTNGYSRDWGRTWCEYLAACLAVGSSVDDAALNRMLAAGITILGCYEYDGVYGGHGAGQHCGHKQMIQLLGHVFHAAMPGLMDKCLDIPGNPTHQSYWVEASHVGQLQFWPDASGLWFHSFYTEHVGMPWFSHQVFRAVDNTTILWNQQYSSEHMADYQTSSCPTSFVEMLNIMLLQAGPSGWTGGQVVARHATNFGPTNPWAACLGYYDRYTKFYNGYWISHEFYEPRHIAYWNDRRPGITSVPVWTGVPDAMSPPDNITLFLNATATGFTWDLTNINGSTSAITGYNIQYSLDGRHWINTTTQAVSGTQTGLTPGLKHYVRYRRQSAAGWGPWSTNWPMYTSWSLTDGPRGERWVITPTGTPANAAPALSVAPKLWKKVHPVASALLWDDATGDTLTQTEVDAGIYSSVGYVTGYPAPTLTYQKVINAVPVGTAGSSSQITDSTEQQGYPVAAKVVAHNTSGADATATSANTNWAGVQVAPIVGDTWITSDLVSVTAHTLDYPTGGLTAGKTLVLVISCHSTALITAVPTGYTLVGNNPAGRMHVFKKLATGAENGGTFAFTTASATLCNAVLFEFEEDIDNIAFNALRGPPPCTAIAGTGDYETGLVVSGTRTDGSLVPPTLGYYDHVNLENPVTPTSSNTSVTMAACSRSSGPMLTETPPDFVVANVGNFNACTILAGPLGTIIADTTKPVLTSASGVGTSSTGATVQVNSDEGNGQCYTVLTGSATKPTDVQVENGQDHLGAAKPNKNDPVTAPGLQTLSVTGLVASTTYHPHIMHKDAAGNRSLVATGASFTTPASITPATFVSAAYNGIEAATTLLVPMPTSMTAGNKLVLLYFCNLGAGNTPNLTAQGFTMLDDDNTGTARTGAIYWKSIVGTEVPFNIVLGAVASQIVSVFQFAGGTSVAGAVLTTSASQAPDGPALTPPWGSAQNLWVSAFHQLRSSPFNVSAYPAGYALNGDPALGTFHRVFDGATLDCMVGSVMKIATGATEDPGIWTQTGNATWGAYTFAITPG